MVVVGVAPAGALRGGLGVEGLDPGVGAHAQERHTHTHADPAGDGHARPVSAGGGGAAVRRASSGAEVAGARRRGARRRGRRHFAQSCRLGEHGCEPRALLRRGVGQPQVGIDEVACLTGSRRSAQVQRGPGGAVDSRRPQRMALGHRVEHPLEERQGDLGAPLLPGQHGVLVARLELRVRGRGHRGRSENHGEDAGEDSGGHQRTGQEGWPRRDSTHGVKPDRGWKEGAVLHGRRITHRPAKATRRAGDGLEERPPGSCPDDAMTGSRSIRPVTNSMAMKSRPSASPSSWIVVTFACVTAAAERASRRNRLALAVAIGRGVGPDHPRRRRRRNTRRPRRLISVKRPERSLPCFAAHCSSPSSPPSPPPPAAARPRPLGRPPSRPVRAAGADAPLAVLAAQPDVLLLDVRRPDEFAAGHVEGAVNVPLGETAQMAALIDGRTGPDPALPVRQPLGQGAGRAAGRRLHVAPQRRGLRDHRPGAGAASAAAENAGAEALSAWPTPARTAPPAGRSTARCTWVPRPRGVP